MSTPVSKQPISSRTPSKGQPKNQLSSLQIVFGSILAISLLLAINFSGRIAAGQRIEGELHAMEATINAQQVTATALKTRLDFIDSPSYIEQWARTEGKMIKPGEMLIIPVPGKQALQPTPTAFITSVRTNPVSTPETQNWQLWWGLFSDSPPPAKPEDIFKPH